MPEPPAGEAELRRLAARFELAETGIRELIAEAALTRARRLLLEEALGILTALRQEDLRRPVITAYLLAFRAVQRGGILAAPGDLAASLHLRLDRGAQHAADRARAAFKRVTADNLDDASHDAVTAHVDDRGTRWTLGSWAVMNTTTIGRQATSRGIAHAVGDGGQVSISVGECGWCQQHAGQGRIGEIPLPPYHPSCSCTASAA
jgi:hypothetical protein